MSSFSRRRFKTFGSPSPTRWKQNTVGLIYGACVCPREVRRPQCVLRWQHLKASDGWNDFQQWSRVGSDKTSRANVRCDKCMWGDDPSRFITESYRCCVTTYFNFYALWVVWLIIHITSVCTRLFSQPYTFINRNDSDTELKTRERGIFFMVPSQ